MASKRLLHDSFYLSVLLLQALNRFLFYLSCLDNIFEFFFSIMHKEKREAKESENLENKMIASCRCESREQHSQYWANDNTPLLRRSA